MTTAAKLTKTAADLRRLRVLRDDLIAQRLSEGATLRCIAIEAGLTHQAIAKIAKHQQNGSNGTG